MGNTVVTPLVRFFQIKEALNNLSVRGVSFDFARERLVEP